MPQQLLTDTLKNQLASLTPRIVHPVELVVSLDDRPASADLAQLLDDIAALSPKITVRRDDDASTRRPAFAITRPGTEISITFAGIPMGHEFSSLVLALLQVGGNPVKEDPELIAQIENLDGDYEFVTYFSLSCQNCPTVVQALNTMAVLNPRIKHTAVEGSLFQDEINERQVLSVPTIYLNGQHFGQGRTTIEQFVARLDANSASREAAKLNAKEPYEVLVVGQGPAGCAAAIYLARKGITTGLVGERFGGQILDTMAIENYISTPYTEGPKLAAALESHVNAYPIDVVKAQSATRLEPASTPSELTTIYFGDDARLQAREVILATGARWRTMNVPGEDEYRNKGVTFCPHCDGPLFKGKDVAVIGGGNSGIEAAIDLAGVTRHVTVVEFMETCKADEILLDKLHSLPNVTVITNAATTEVVGDGTQVTALRYTDRATSIVHELAVAGIFVQIGLLPNTEWLGQTVELNGRGEIVVDERGVTSTPGIFAAGDCSSIPFKQIVIAQGSGATAGLSAWEHLIRTQS